MIKHRNYWDRTFFLLEGGAALLLLTTAVVIGPFFHIYLPNSGLYEKILLLVLGVALLLVLCSLIGSWISQKIAVISTRFSLVQILLIGVVVQVVVAAITHPIPTSDGATYLDLARKLASGERYENSMGVAFWPVGFPLVLCPFVYVLGATFAACVATNIFLYAVGAFSAFKLGEQIFDRHVGLASALLFTVWPARLLMSGVAAKENLTIAATLAGAALCAAAMQKRAKPSIGLSACAGVAFGIASLAQPGLLLLLFSIPLCYRNVAKSGILRFLTCCGVVVACAALTMAPWQARNCMVFDGAFCGVATNGGSNFYRANNSLATGEWIAEGTIPITHLPELEQNRLGFEWGKKWIKENPGEFGLLAVKKLAILLKNDDHGAYWSIMRGRGGDHASAVATASASRIFAYRFAEFISWLFWLIIITQALRKIANDYQSKAHDSWKILPFVYPFFYVTAVFAVFESGSRQHMIAFAVLIILAAASAVSSPRHSIEQSSKLAR